MQKYTATLLKQIDKVRENENISPGDLEVSLDVTTINDDDPGIKFKVYSRRRSELPQKGELKIYGSNPLLFKVAIRKAETIATEAWAYFTSQGTRCSVHHYPPSLLV